MVTILCYKALTYGGDIMKIRLAEVARRIGVKYWTVYYTVRWVKDCPVSLRPGYSERDVERLRNYFSQKTKVTTEATN